MATTATVKGVRWAGPYTSGETPLPFTMKFDPTDIDFDGFALAVTLLDDDGTEMNFAGQVEWEDIATGLVKVSLAADDVAMPVGKLVITRRLQVWAGNAVNKIASLEIKYNCHPAIGTPPVLP